MLAGVAVNVGRFIGLGVTTAAGNKDGEVRESALEGEAS